MAELKTRVNDNSVTDFLNSVANEKRRKDGFELLEMMKAATGGESKMWGGSIIGFGNYHYKYASGREGDWFKIGFSPRVQKISLYLMSGHQKHAKIIERLGKHKTSKGCIYVNKLDDVNRDVLIELFKAHWG